MNQTNLNLQIYNEWKEETLDSLFYFDKYVLGYDANIRPEKVGLEEETHRLACEAGY